MSVKVGLQYIDLWRESLEEQVCAYEKETVPEGEIVFYGSSEFTRWKREVWDHKPLEEVIVGKSGAKCAHNRGFGSSCSEHQLYYYPRMVRALKPKVLVYSGSGNYGAFGYTVEEAWELAQRVLVYAQTDFPDIHLYLCSTQPRKGGRTEKQQRDAIAYNEFLQEFAAKTPNCFYIDLFNYEPLQDRQDIYVEDGHYNQLGYDIFGNKFKEALRDELARY